MLFTSSSHSLRKVGFVIRLVFKTNKARIDCRELASGQKAIQKLQHKSARPVFKFVGATFFAKQGCGK